MYLARPQRILLPLLSCCLIVLFAACGSGTTSPKAIQIPAISATPSGSASMTPSISPTVSASTTQTGCPATGTARAAVMPSLGSGNHQNIVYIVNEFQGSNPTFGTLKRYDVMTGTKTEIIKIPQVFISDAQISTDGQWILFVATSSAAEKLQMIRMDGQDLQTLYCDTQKLLGEVDWSPNERLVIFSNEEDLGIYLLNMQSGSVQLEVRPINLGNSTWFDDTHVYLMPAGVDTPTDTVYMLDLSRGANQPSSDLVQVFQQPHTPNRYPCVDYDSYSGSKLFISQCAATFFPQSSAVGKRQGPSAIGVQLLADTSLHTIFTSTTLAITMVRTISSRILLLLVENFSEDHSVDTSQNGLWKINIDGSGLTRLTTQDEGFATRICEFTRTPWANGSRDGSMYAFEIYNNQSNSLLFGSLSGGPPTTFASISDGTQLSIVGWTTM